MQEHTPIFNEGSKNRFTFKRIYSLIYKILIEKNKLAGENNVKHARTANIRILQT